MTSEIRTNSLKSRAGLSTVTLTDTGPMFSGITTFVDNSTFSVGTGGTIHAPATNTLNIGVNNTESIRIDSNSNLKVAGIVTATHFHGDGSNLTGITVPGGGTGLDLNDGVKIRLGTGNDMEFHHTSGDNIINYINGNLIIKKGSASNSNSIQFDGNGHMYVPDDDAIYFGSSADLHLSHRSSDESAVIKANNSTGFLRILAGVSNSGGILLKNKDDDITYLRARNEQGVELFYASNKKFETTNTGATITGDLYTTSRLLVNTTSPGESNGDEATFANPGGNAGITIRSAVNNECKIYFSEGTSGGSQYRGAINYNQNTNYMAFSANEYERMRITSDGTLRLNYYNQNTGRGRILFGSSAPAFIEGYDTGNAGSGAYLKFGTNGTDRMRIDNSGHTFFSGMDNLTASGSNKGINIENSSNNGRMNIHANSSAGNALGISFYNNGNNVGTIYYGTSSTAYNTSSDYRLKENEVSISDGITRLKSLKPYRFNFKVDPDKTVDGFFAHEVAPVIPEAVTGEKDAEDMQQIDQAKLVPLLTAALQEAIAEIETLKTKVAALEGS